MSVADAEALFGHMLDDDMSTADVTDILTTLADRGETVAEIVGAVRAMQARMIGVCAPPDAIDVCGTGGDGSHSLNVSTAVAIVVAACDVPVAKHGNRAASSQAGAADTLEALGLNLDRAMDTAEATLADLGICFLFAQKHHPALARIAPIRKSIGRRTIFNLIGPLASPARVNRQVIGIAQRERMSHYADALTALNCKDFMLVAGYEPLDELSVSDASQFLRKGGQCRQISPECVGFVRHEPTALLGGDARFNAAALTRLLNGETGAYRDAVLFNTAAALMIAGHANDWHDGIEHAAEAIDRGLAKTLLACWISY